MYGDSENIEIRNCYLKSTSAACKIGTESRNDFKNIRVSNCTIEDSNRGISLQLRDNGNISDIVFENITITTRRFSREWWGSGEAIAITVIPRYLFTKNGTIKNVVFKNITCNCENGVLVYAKNKKRFEHIVFENVKINLMRKTKWFQENYDLRPGVDAKFLKKAITEYCFYNVDKEIHIK